MKKVQLNLAKNKLTNEKGEKFIYKGLYNSSNALYFVYNSKRPSQILALTEVKLRMLTLILRKTPY